MKITEAKIGGLLYRLGVTANYTGFSHMSCAVRLCAEEPGRLLLVTKLVYPEVARQYGTNWKAVERNIRTAASLIWRENRPLLEALARRPLAEKPYSSQLLAILSYHLLSMKPDSLPVQGLCEPIAFAGEDHNMRMVDETVNESRGKAVVPKDSVPLGELQI